MGKTNMIYKFVSLITRGVDLVVTPFHPFDGAVDIIVVQQQDGSFRSTPWYVQFGKFQGVLKGAEEIVRINVNGVETNFYMYLDYAGEAYFVREVNLGDESEKNGVSKDKGEGTVDRVNSEKISGVSKESVDVYRLQSTKFDTGVMRDDYSSLGPERLERIGSDTYRFYDFQDDQSFHGSVELSEYGSSRIENLDVRENFVEEQGMNSKMVLVTGGGHILMAPISSSERSTENVQLATPQFHLVPGEGNGFCGELEEFSVNETSRTAGYINDLDASSSQGDSVNPRCVGKNTNSLEQQSEVCKDGEHVPMNQVTDNVDQSKIKKDEADHVHPHEDTDELHWMEACKEDEKHVNKGTGGVHEDLKGWRYVYQDRGTHDRRESEHVEKSQEAHEIHQHENSKVDSKCASDDQVPNSTDPGVCNDFMDSPSSIKKDDVFNSCVDLTKVAVEKETRAKDSPIEVHAEGKDREETPLQSLNASYDCEIESSHDKHPTDARATDISEGTSINEVKIDSLSSRAASDSPVHVSSLAALRKEIQTGEHIATSVDVNKSQDKDEHVGLHSNNEAVERSPESDTSEAACSRSEVVDPGAVNSSEEIQGNSSSRLEISLCRHLLRPGMGLSAADEAFNAHRISQEDFKCSASSVVKNKNLVIRFGERYLSWDKAAPIVLGMPAFGLDLPIDLKDAIPVEEDKKPKFQDNDSGRASASHGWGVQLIPLWRFKTAEHSSNTTSNDEVSVDPESVSQRTSNEPNPISRNVNPKSETVLKSPGKEFIRTHIPTSEQIASLNLKEGQNNVTFSYSTRFLGLQQVKAHIYLWNWNARIVISDVDGTITKSDVLGQVMPLVGKDWSQFGVAQLFSAIKENGYHLLFLSARAIVQAYLTKSFLFNLKQDGKTLPIGPVVISPNGLFPSLFREGTKMGVFVLVMLRNRVIRRAPHEFKIACLEDIKALFPLDYNPFYAGFGNRDMDELTYKKMGIHDGKIFIINPKGEVAMNHGKDKKSYTSLHTLVNDMFPPTSMLQQEDYNSWNYWKLPLPDIDD